MEFVRGVTMEELQLTMSTGRIPMWRVGLWLGQLCQVLHAAHGAGILHRDLSLANIMLANPGTADETIKVMDFGLARLTGGVYVPLEKLQGQAESIGGGTPDFLCPEQIRGEPVDARSDLYSVGVILYKLMTGHLPFEKAQGVAQILDAQVRQPPPRFAQFQIRDVSPAVEAVVQHCLAKYPAERPGSARELAEEFGRAVHQVIAPPEAFADVAPVVDDAPRFDPKHVIDRLEAWMPEPIAVVKLRGFAGEVGGEIVDSQPGVIRIGFVDPRQPAPQKSGWFSKAPQTPPACIYLDLHMKKKQVGPRNLVEITVVRDAKHIESREAARERQGYAERICKELRAYLMIGR
jgi:serine/threonine-protein kinase